MAHMPAESSPRMGVFTAGRVDERRSRAPGVRRGSCCCAHMQECGDLKAKTTDIDNNKREIINNYGIMFSACRNALMTF